VTVGFYNLQDLQEKVKAFLTTEHLMADLSR